MLASHSTAVTLRIFTGAMIWAVHFGTLYAVTAVACAKGFDAVGWMGFGFVGWVLASATVLALVAESAIVVTAARAAVATGFADWMRAGVAALSAFAIVLQALPVMMVPPCA